MSEIQTINLDLRGLACPGPVIETRKALSEFTNEVFFSIKLDNQAACSNVSRFAESQGCTVTATNDNDDTFTLTITRSPINSFASADKLKPQPESITGNYTIYVDKATMGSGDQKLGRILMKAFLKTLPELTNLPRNIIFLNQGVFLTANDSPELATIKSLATAGSAILVCGTCLDFYNLKDSLGVGRVSNMFEIASIVTGPDKVIKI